MREWLPHRRGFLDRLLNMEAPKAGRGCNDWEGVESGDALTVCERQLCTKCCLKRHTKDFLHRVQKWTCHGEIGGVGDGRVDPGGGNEFEGEGVEGEDEGGSKGEGDRERECEGKGTGEEQWETIVQPELIVGDDGDQLAIGGRFGMLITP